MTGTENPKAITMDANHSVTANFALDVNYTLTVTADHGTVTKTPDAEQYLSGTVGFLTRLPRVPGITSPAGAWI